MTQFKERPSIFTTQCMPQEVRRCEAAKRLAEAIQEAAENWIATPAKNAGSQ